MNDTTRRYPRTIQQAFGATESSHITEPTRPFDWEDRAVLWGCVFAVVAIAAIGYLT